MINISVAFRKARDKEGKKPGVVYFRLSGLKGDGHRGVLSFNTDITGTDESIIDTNKERIAVYARLVYHVIEQTVNAGRAATVDTVAKKARKLINDNGLREDIIASLNRNASLRADIVSVGGGLHNQFKFIYPSPQKECTGSSDLLAFISFKSQLSRSENKISTSRSYSYLQKELSQYCNSAVISWRRVDQDLVVGFASWLTERGYKESTQAYYLGMLRTILFQASEKGYCSATPQWFKPVKTWVGVKPKDGVTGKLDISVLKKIAALNLDNKPELSLARDMFMFAFYCRGMELVDVAHLTEKNIREGMLVYNRRLTGKEIRVPIEKEAAAILSRYPKGKEHVFPLLESGRSILFATRRNRINKQIKEVGKLVGYSGLTFVMNIDAWASLVAGIHIAETLFNYHAI